MRHRFVAAVLLVLCACVAPDDGSRGRGWAGAGASFEYLPHEGTPWSFAVDGSDLQLVHGRDELSIAGAVPAGGMVYELVAIDGPKVVFDLAGGHRAIWRGAVLELDGVPHAFGGEVRRLRLGGD